MKSDVCTCCLLSGVVVGAQEMEDIRTGERLAVKRIEARTRMERDQVRPAVQHSGIIAKRRHLKAVGHR